MSRWRLLRQRVARETRDLLELVLLPASAALVPWSLGFQWLKLLARWDWLYRAQCADALEAAKAYMTVSDPVAWSREHRLVMLIDHADLYLSRTRSDAWIRKHMDVQGEWAVQGQSAILVTFHWAAGMWAHRQARASGLSPHFLLARHDEAGFVGRQVWRRYAGARTHTVGLADGNPVILVPGAMRTLRGVLEQNEQVIAVIDVPPDQVKQTSPQRFLDRTVHMPIALPRLAVEQGIPVTVFTLGFDLATGQRDLRLYPLGVWKDAEALATRIFAELDRIVRERPACWHFWFVADRFFAGRTDPEGG